MTRVEVFSGSEDGVVFPRIVPLAVLMGAVAGLLQWLLPTEVLTDVAYLEDIDPNSLMLSGALLATAGFALTLAGHWALWRRGADVDPAQPVTVLVTDGVFGWTRNPIYLGLWIALTGVALTFALDWLLIVIVPAAMIVNRVAVRQEECHLAHKFGRAYQSYARRVPRYFFMH